MLSAKPRRIPLGSFRKKFSSQSECKLDNEQKRVLKHDSNPPVLQVSSLKSCFMKTTTTTKAEDDKGSPTATQ